MIPKSRTRFSEKIMLHRKSGPRSDSSDHGLGWVEHSETHRPRFSVGFAPLNPPYALLRLRLMCACKRRHLAAEIAFGPVNAFTERKADKAGDLDRPADLAFGFLDRLCNGLLALFDGVALLKQTNFLVEGSQAGLDDLLDD